MRTPEEAGAYLRTLRAIVQYLGVCDGNMEEGSFRCDANVSIRPPGTTGLGTKIEIKNLNSFRAVERALAFEIDRQGETLNAGGTLAQETRLWDEQREETRSMRSKESAHDYRYFPDPDLPPLYISNQWIAQIRGDLPELPAARRMRFSSAYGLSSYDADLLTSRKDVADYFEGAVKCHDNPKALANWIVGDLFRVLKERRLDEQLHIVNWPVSAARLAELVSLIDEGKISGRIAKSVFDQMLESGESPRSIVSEKGLEQVSDASSIEATIDQVLAANAKQVQQYADGNEKVFGYLVGQIMKASRGKANPQKVNEILREKLKTGTGDS
jgi:aspartyl-tRNA(Asn)/glutamyl-tRNA(Gln) amidotransferase subunit B